MKTTSGIAIFNDDKILLCHSTGNKHWDIPKGIMEGIETPIETAIRECEEEISYIFVKSELQDLGEFKYSSAKNLHLFKTFKDLDINKLHCTSYFKRYGREFPEVDDYKYFSKTEALEKSSKVLRKILEKDKLWEQY